MSLVNGGRRDAEAFPEHAAEMRGARKAPGESDIGDGLAAMGLQLLPAMLQPRPPDVIADGHASFTEQHVQITLGTAKCRRNLVDAQVGIAQMLADEGLRP